MKAPRNKLLRSKTPLRRKARLRPRRATARRSDRARDPEYLRQVRTLPCSLRLLGLCSGPIQAHHAGRHPMGRKADDSTAIPLCQKHHGHLHDVIGTRRARPWADKVIEQTRAALGWKEAA